MVREVKVREGRVRYGTEERKKEYLGCGVEWSTDRQTGRYRHDIVMRSCRHGKKAQKEISLQLKRRKKERKKKERKREKKKEKEDGMKVRK